MTTYNSGIVVASLPTLESGARAMALQANGSIVLVGFAFPPGAWDQRELLIMRYLPDGTLDPSFNGGYVTSGWGSQGDSGWSVAIQTDGKILVTGETLAGNTHNFALVRFNADGSLDTSFNGTGKVLVDIGSGYEGYDFSDGVTLQSDGKIVVVGTCNDENGDFTVMRFNTDGSLDTSFGQAGRILTDVSPQSSDVATDVVVQPDGKIVVAGYSFAGPGAAEQFVVTRYNADGSVDATFNSTGKVVAPPGVFSDDQGQCLAIQGDGKIVLVGLGYYGPTSTAFAVMRYNADGSPDTSFNGTGSVLTGFAESSDNVGHSVALQDDGKIVVAGYCFIDRSSVITVARYNSDGTLDTGFNGTGTVVTALPATVSESATGLAIQSDGKIVVTGSETTNNGTDAGDTNVVLVRYNADGSLDATFNPVNQTLTGTGSADSLTGGAGHDLLAGLAGNDTLLGGAGHDTLIGGVGTDSMDGGDGSDLYIINVATEHAVAEIRDNGSSGTDEVRFAATKASTLTLVAGDTGIERVALGTGTGVVAVTTATTANGINAAAVTNALTLIGNAGANKIVGTAYNDTIEGGPGNDSLAGGAGADTFVFDTAPNARANRDVVTDFQSGVDTIQLSKTIFTAISGTSGTTLTATQFWSAAGATSGHDADDRIIYNTTTGVLYYDPDGNGSAAAIAIAVIGTTTHPALIYSDILLGP